MIERIVVDKNLLVVYEILLSLEYFNFDTETKEKLEELTNYFYKKIYNSSLNNPNDILEEKCILEYTFEK